MSLELSGCCGFRRFDGERVDHHVEEVSRWVVRSRKMEETICDLNCVFGVGEVAVYLERRERERRKRLVLGV